MGSGPLTFPHEGRSRLPESTPPQDITARRLGTPLINHQPTRLGELPRIPSFLFCFSKTPNAKTQTLTIARAPVPDRVSNTKTRLHSWHCRHRIAALPTRRRLLSRHLPLARPPSPEDQVPGDTNNDNENEHTHNCARNYAFGREQLAAILLYHHRAPPRRTPCAVIPVTSAPVCHRFDTPEDRSDRSPHQPMRSAGLPLVGVATRTPNSMLLPSSFTQLACLRCGMW